MFLLVFRFFFLPPPLACHLGRGGVGCGGDLEWSGAGGVGGGLGQRGVLWWVGLGWAELDWDG